MLLEKLISALQNIYLLKAKNLHWVSNLLLMGFKKKSVMLEANSRNLSHVQMKPSGWAAALVCLLLADRLLSSRDSGRDTSNETRIELIWIFLYWKWGQAARRVQQVHYQHAQGPSLSRRWALRGNGLWAREDEVMWPTCSSSWSCLFTAPDAMLSNILQHQDELKAGPPSWVP